MPNNAGIIASSVTWVKNDSHQPLKSQEMGWKDSLLRFQLFFWLLSQHPYPGLSHGILQLLSLFQPQLQSRNKTKNKIKQKKNSWWKLLLHKGFSYLYASVYKTFEFRIQKLNSSGTHFFTEPVFMSLTTCERWGRYGTINAETSLGPLAWL